MRYFLVVFAFILSACSTRQVAPELSGSTAQRLVTYSIEKLISELPAEDFAQLGQKKVHIQSHFIKENQVLSYADQMLRLDLLRRFNLNITDELNEADIELHFFFTSLGTDTDTYGLTIPIVDFSDTSQSTNINILAVDMYHGISEFMYYVKDNETNKIIKKRKMIARIRNDKFSTPILDFPISNID
ncbi:MAG: hypothetical protein OQJ89_02715 [Kangiellaceae bacterium]|nr:hypothetical protein [Kangiellaceae bacterium]MCW9015859.1 hypothetical protein [Kangiellaceae bacterium]